MSYNRRGKKPKDTDNMKSFDIETRILKFGLNSDPTSVNVVAKRLQMSESSRNLGMLRNMLDRMFSEKKVYMDGTRFAIDYNGARHLMKPLPSHLLVENIAMNQVPMTK